MEKYGKQNLTLLEENRGISLWPQDMKGIFKQFTKKHKQGW